MRQPVCASTPVSVADRLAHAQQLRGFNHVIFTQSRDAQQLFNLVCGLHGAHEGVSGRQGCTPHLAGASYCLRYVMRGV